VEQIRSSQGRMPSSLDELAYTLPESVFTDPYSGQPLVYIPGSDTFLLYSVGPNQTDNGGRHDWRDGDIVWRGTKSE